MYTNRDRAISEIKVALARRSSISWNIEEGEGTGEILVTPPGKKWKAFVVSLGELKNHGKLENELFDLFGFPDGLGLKRHQIVCGQIEIKGWEYEEFIARAEGRVPTGDPLADKEHEAKRIAMTHLRNFEHDWDGYESMRYDGDIDPERFDLTCDWFSKEFLTRLEAQGETEESLQSWWLFEEVDLVRKKLEYEMRFAGSLTPKEARVELERLFQRCRTYPGPREIFPEALMERAQLTLADKDRLFRAMVQKQHRMNSRNPFLDDCDSDDLEDQRFSTNL
jgi:hypothetical protein